MHVVKVEKKGRGTDEEKIGGEKVRRVQVGEEEEWRKGDGGRKEIKGLECKVIKRNR